jgi:hypothetical protein
MSDQGRLIVGISSAIEPKQLSNAVDKQEGRFLTDEDYAIEPSLKISSTSGDMTAMVFKAKTTVPAFLTLRHEQIVFYFLPCGARTIESQAGSGTITPSGLAALSVPVSRFLSLKPESDRSSQIKHRVVKGVDVTVERLSRDSFSPTFPIPFTLTFTSGEKVQGVIDGKFHMDKLVLEWATRVNSFKEAANKEREVNNQLASSPNAISANQAILVLPDFGYVSSAGPLGTINGVRYVAMLRTWKGTMPDCGPYSLRDSFHPYPIVLHRTAQNLDVEVSDALEGRRMFKRTYFARKPCPPVISVSLAFGSLPINPDEYVNYPESDSPGGLPSDVIARFALRRSLSILK